MKAQRGVTYSLVRYGGLDYYVEGDVEPHQLSPRARLLSDGITLPEGDGGIELLDLPEGALAYDPDPEDRGDYLRDQEKDDRATGDR